MRTFALAEVKSVEGKAPTGEFEAVLSAPTLDRDGEVIDEGAFAPLPESVPVHAFHDFHDPIGRGVPTYEGGVLMLRGVFASTPRAQEIRTLVTEGIIANMSVGFMAASREQGEDGLTHVRSGEILEGSFVSIPSNREAGILVAKDYDAKAGARNSATDSSRLQQIHDLSVENGAECKGHVPADVKNLDTGKGTAPAEEPAAKAASDAAEQDPTADVLAQTRLFVIRERAASLLL